LRLLITVAKQRRLSSQRDSERLLNSQKQFQRLGCPLGNAAAYSSFSDTLQEFTNHQLLPFISAPRFTLFYNSGTWLDGVAVKRLLRNQPDRLPRDDRFSIRVVAGVCPSCALSCACSGEDTSREDILGVIYRRSGHSITFRCNHCSLQWTVTLHNLRRAALAKAASIKDNMLAYAYSTVLDGTRGVPKREAARRSSIKRQTRRRVILLPDSLEKFT
jgi:hypothetical protein